MTYQKKKKKTFLVVSLLIISLVIVGIFFFIRSNSTSQTKSDKKNVPDSQESSWYRELKDNVSQTKNDEKLFYYTFCIEIWEGGNLDSPNRKSKIWRKFEKVKNGVRYELSIVYNHPSLTNINFPVGKVNNKAGRYYQITGINFADFEQKKMRDGPYFEKRINLEDKDKIIVTPVNP